ncbi:beta-barrel assembly-enhancing protease [Abditibacteriota bacterium]|nr:beta-barrel assembly-enhancing protease [Abditibacteriota bacterium]
MKSLRLFALSLGVCAIATTATIRPAHAISDEEEIQAGREMAQQAIKEYGQPLSPSDPRQQRVSRIGAMFARQSSRRNIPYSYTVLQNEKVLNAFAGPGGPVFVTTKLLETAQNDAELAYVLGHETGHIEKRHIVKSAQKSQTVGIGAAILGSILGGSRGGDLVGGLVNVGAGLWQKGFSRSQESEADDYGTRAMARLGFDPRAAVSMLGRLGDGPDGLAKYLSDHPTSKAREEKVGKEINDEGLLAVARANGGPILNISGSNAGYAPSYGAGYSPVASADDASFEARVVTENGGRVVLVPVVDMARLARAEWSERGDGIAVRTDTSGQTSGIFRANSDEATINGRTATLSARARRIGGKLYAPVGAVSAAVGGHASLQSDNSILVTFGTGRSYVIRF